MGFSIGGIFPVKFSIGGIFTMEFSIGETFPVELSVGGVFQVEFANHEFFSWDVYFSPQVCFSHR